MCLEAAEPIFDMPRFVEVGGVGRVRRRHTENERIGRCCRLQRGARIVTTGLVGLSGCGVNARWRGPARREPGHTTLR
jgi:hypothetical protein